MREVVVIMEVGTKLRERKVREDNSLTDKQRKHFKESLRHNHELMKRLAQM